MYLRYLAKFYSTEQEIEAFGFFSAAYYLQRSHILEQIDSSRLDKLLLWFEKELPIPNYYHKVRNHQKAKAATSWFRDTAQRHIAKMNEMAVILEKYQVEIKRIGVKKLQGKVIYEDEYQLTIIPYRDVSKRMF